MMSTVAHEVAREPRQQARGVQRRRMKSSVAKLLASTEEVPLSDRELSLQSEVLRLLRLTRAILDCDAARCYLCAKCIAVLTQTLPEKETRDAPVFAEDDPIRRFRGDAPVQQAEVHAVEDRVVKQKALLGKFHTGRLHQATIAAAKRRNMPVEEFIQMRASVG